MDIFERVLADRKKTDIFERTLNKKLNGDVFERLDKIVPPIVREYVRSQKTRFPSHEIIALIKSEISKLPKAEPIEKVIEKEIKIIEKKDDKKYAELELVKELKKQIETLTKELKETRKLAEEPLFIPGGPGVIGIPPPEGNPEGSGLLISNGQAKWGTVSSNGGATANPFYIGDANTDGSWRFYNDGTNLITQRRESGTWVEKGATLA